LRDKHITTTIPQPRDQIANRLRKGRNGGRPPRFDPDVYKRRNQVERGFNRRKHWRGLATRYDKLGAHFQATLDLVEMLDWQSSRSGCSGGRRTPAWSWSPVRRSPWAGSTGTARSP
jgi:transposase